MTIQQSVHAIFNQLEDSLLQLSNEQYSQKIDTLSGASIGQHVRHVVEMFVCLQDGYTSGIVNYENRKRDIAIETAKGTAIDVMNKINAALLNENNNLVLEAGFDENSDELNKIPTNYFREIAYNLEHAVHHMALIKIGINEVSDTQLPDGYGVASLTIKYRKETAG
ncbi:MAG: hypothetical protein ABIN67_13635 [Ferruginibacter sp.]